MPEWIITHNYLDDKPAAVKFRLYDDDNILYFEGYMPLHYLESEKIFDPLDYARDSWGTTRIDYLNPNTGEWETV